MVTHNSDVQLGFGEPPRASFIFVKNEGDYLWYMWDHDANKRIPITQKALHGYITDLQMVVRDFQGEDKPKLRLSVQADKTYVIQSGLDSTFSRGILQAMHSMEEDQRVGIVSITVEGNDPNRGNLPTVFGNIYVSGSRVKFDWDRDADMMELIQQVQKDWGFTQRADHEEEGSEAGSADQNVQTDGKARVSADILGKLDKRFGEANVHPTRRMALAETISERRLKNLSDLTVKEARELYAALNEIVAGTLSLDTLLGVDDEPTNAQAPF